MKRFLVVGLVVAFLTSATYVLGYSTLFTVSSIEIVGSKRPVNTGIVKGQKLARVEPRAVANQLKKLDWIRSAEVSRNWISGKVVVEITARIPIAAFENQVIDSTASSFMPDGIQLEGLIQIQAANLSDAKKGVKFLAQLPQELRSTLKVVKISTTGVLVLITQNGGKEIEVRWGSSSENELKLKVYRALLALPENADVKLVDVSAPIAPIVK